VPVEAGNYSNLAANKENLFYGKTAPSTTVARATSKPSLMVLQPEGPQGDARSRRRRRRPTLVGRAEVVVRSGNEIAIYDASPKGKDSKKDVPTAGLMVDRVPKQEWIQIFNEVGGATATTSTSRTCTATTGGAAPQYGQLLEYVAHRADLNYVLGEMVSELNVGPRLHRGGDWAEPERREGRAAGLPVRARQASGATRSRRSSRAERGGALPLAADRDRRRRARRRLRARDRRRDLTCTRTRTACCATRPTGRSSSR
jgi:tricorn protease